MGGIVKEVISFFRRSDFVEVIFLYLSEHYELLLIAAAIIFIMVLSLWVILERLRKKGWVALIPLYRFVVLFKAIGLRTWCAVLMLIPGVNISMRIVFYIALAKRFNRNYFFVPLLVILPLVFLPIVAFGEGQHIYVKRERKLKKIDSKHVRDREHYNVERPLPKERYVAYEDVGEAKEDVMSMAELRKERAQAQVKKITTKVQSESTKSIVERKTVAVKKMMPEMKQGPIGEKYSNAEARYERLLKEQEARQKRREQAKKKMVSNTHAPVDRPMLGVPNAHLTANDVRASVNTTKKIEAKPEPRPSARRTRIDF
ncbi:hypothetical protein IK146_00750 [Candidatus Saccharibacteria bacterium]|nr:hypothetical protein [Candidatus Saccharibacteria bacterium]